MAKKEEFSLSIQERRRRSFSDNFKRGKVEEIERGMSSVTEISNQYCVSKTAVYKWISKFGSQKEKEERLILESMSDTRALQELKHRIAELERMIGQKQIEIDFYKKMIDLAEEEYGVEIKKKCSIKRLDTFGSIKDKRDTK